MRPPRGVIRASVVATSLLSFASVALAQEAAPAPAAPAAPAAEPAPAPAPTPAPEPVAAPAPVASTTVEAPPAPAVPAEAAPEAADEPSPIKFLFFADANAGYQTSKLGTPLPWHRAYEWNAPNGAGGFGNHNGFQLSFLGLDVNYDAGVFGATGSLRFGPSVPIFYAGAGKALPYGIENVTQAFVTVKPVDGLSVDLGQFATIYGAEVAESWRNLNYSRGGLYYGFQPFWHTGLRVKYAFNDMFALTGMVVNGVNTVVADDESPSYGIQAAFTPAPAFSLYAGGLFAGDGKTDTSGFDRFFDVVAILKLDAFTGIANFDFNQNVDGLGPDQNSSFWGGSLALGYQVTDWFGAAVRGEYLVDSNNRLYLAGQVSDDTGVVTPAADQKVAITTGTLTLDFKPFPKRKSLIVRWDNRIETASVDGVFVNGDGANSKSWFGSVLGLVVTTE